VGNQSVTLNRERFNQSVVVQWFDPTSGNFAKQKNVENKGKHMFTAPGRNTAGQMDWVLGKEK
jgi:hypothetical protein